MVISGQRAQHQDVSSRHSHETGHIIDVSFVITQMDGVGLVLTGARIHVGACHPYYACPQVAPEYSDGRLPFGNLSSFVDGKLRPCLSGTAIIQQCVVGADNANIRQSSWAQNDIGSLCALKL